MKKIKEWTKKHPYWFALIVAILFLLLEHMPLHADEKTSGDYAKDATIDALGAATAFAAGVEQATTDNFYTGAGLFALGTLEAEKAWNEAKQAWETRDGNSSDSSSGSNGPETENHH